jgi:hypothetical protein
VFILFIPGQIIFGGGSAALGCLRLFAAKSLPPSLTSLPSVKKFLCPPSSRLRGSLPRIRGSNFTPVKSVLSVLIRKAPSKLGGSS